MFVVVTHYSIIKTIAQSLERAYITHYQVIDASRDRLINEQLAPSQIVHHSVYIIDNLKCQDLYSFSTYCFCNFPALNTAQNKSKKVANPVRQPYTWRIGFESVI